MAAPTTADTDILFYRCAVFIFLSTFDIRDSLA